MLRAPPAVLAVLADRGRLRTAGRFTGQVGPSQYAQLPYRTRSTVRNAHNALRLHRLSGHARVQPRISVKAGCIGEYVDGDRPGRQQYCGVFRVAPCVRSLSLCIPKRALAGVLQRANFAESRRTCSFWPGASPARCPAYMCSVSEPLTAPGAFTAMHTCICPCAGNTESTSMVRTTRDDREPGCTSTSRTWDVSRAGLCQRQLVLSDF